MGAKGFSPRTLANRRGGVVALVAWLAERGVTRPAEVTRLMVERYQRALFRHRKLDGAPLSFRAQSQRLVSVQAFFRWATRAGYLPANPASEIELPKSELRLPKPTFSVAEAEAVLAEPDIAEPLGLGTGPCSRSCTRPGCGAPNWRSCRCSTWTPSGPPCWCARAKGGRTAWSPSASGHWPGWAVTWPR